MAEKKPKIAKKRKLYRLVVLRDDSFEELGSLRLTKSNLVVLVSTLTVVLVLITSLLFIFTPIKYYLTGSSDDPRDELLALTFRADSIEQQMNMHNVQMSNLQSILSGEVDTTKKKLPELQKVNPQSVDLTKVDSMELMMRAEVARATQFDLKHNAKNDYGDRDLHEIAFFPPIKGTVTSDYEADEMHFGVDIVAPHGEPVKSVLDGTVVYSGWSVDNGYVIGVQHANNLVSFYKHNSKLLKKVGNFVRAGEVVSIIGNSGEMSSGPHLHFELWYNGSAVNPADFIQF